MQVIMNGNGIKINGMKVEGNCVVIRNGQMTVDGKVVNRSFEAAEITIEGNVNSIECYGNVTVHGNVGEIDCGGSVKVSGDVKGDIDCGGSCTCGNVSGDIDAGGSVRCTR